MKIFANNMVSKAFRQSQMPKPQAKNLDLTVDDASKQVFKPGVELHGDSTDAIRGKNIKLEYDSDCK